MTPGQAAKIIGCSAQQVRTLIRTGKIQATKIDATFADVGYPYFWDITEAEAIRARDRKTDGRGWPKGKRRL